MNLRAALRYLDPWYHWDVVAKYFKVKNPITDLAFTFFAAFFIFYLMSLVLHSRRPIVAVISPSMIPDLPPGDAALVMGVDPREIRAPEVYYPGDLRRRYVLSLVSYDPKSMTLSFQGENFRIDRNGDIIVYYDDLCGRDIIHRVILKIRTPHGYFFLTKGDNNPVPDFYCPDVVGCSPACIYPYFIPEENVYGKIVLKIPFLGIPRYLLARIFGV